MDRDAALASLRPHVRDYAAPVDVLIETTTRCNLDCCMCPHGTLERPQGMMSRETWTRVVDQIAVHWKDARIWPAIMGEPLLRGPELFSMIDDAKTLGVAQVCLNTNLQPLRSEQIDDLLDCGIGRLFIGVDAATPATYAKIRRGGDYDELLDRIHAVLAANARRKDGPRIALQFVVQDQNAHEEKLFVDTWQRAGYDVELKIRPRVGWSYGVESSREIQSTAAAADRIPCLWLLRQMAIFWNGDVPRCDSDYEGREIHGNVLRDDLITIWRRLGALRRRHLNHDFDFGPCANCDDWAAGRSESVQCEAEAT